MQKVSDDQVAYHHDAHSAWAGRAASEHEESDRDEVAEKTMRVLIVSAVRLLRNGLAMMLEHRPRLDVVRTACSADDALRVLRGYAPTLILLDVSAPDGLAAAQRIAACVRDVQIIGFAASDLDHDVLAYAAAGIAAFVSRDASTEELFAAVDFAAAGELLCSPRAAGSMFRRLAALAGRRDIAVTTSADTSLTGREREIVHCIDEGMSNKEIARRLRIGVSTVKNHVHHILEKLKVTRRAEAAARVRGGDAPGARMEN